MIPGQRKDAADRVDDKGAVQLCIAGLVRGHDPDSEKEPCGGNGPSRVVALCEIALVECNNGNLTRYDPDCRQYGTEDTKHCNFKLRSNCAGGMHEDHSDIGKVRRGTKDIGDLGDEDQGRGNVQRYQELDMSFDNSC